jgi:hypothetical protein
MLIMRIVSTEGDSEWNESYDYYYVIPVYLSEIKAYLIRASMSSSRIQDLFSYLKGSTKEQADNLIPFQHHL